MDEDRLRAFPDALPAPASYGGGSYRRDDAHVALLGTAAAPEKGTRIVPVERAEGRTVAVYRSPSGELVAPTGVLFVRFTEGSRADDRRDALEAIGLSIVRVPSFAPHTAYVQSKSGDVADVLRRIADIARIPSFEVVEVQMAREVQRK